MLQPNIIANIVGVFSLLGAIVVVYPTVSYSFIGASRQNLISFKVSYFSLLITICLGLIHGLLMTQSTGIDFYHLSTYWVYAVGLFAFNLLIFLALTFSELKRDLNKLNCFNYAILFLLLLHIGQKAVW